MCYWIYRRCTAHNEVVYDNPVNCEKGNLILTPFGTTVRCPDIKGKETMRKEYVDMICPMCEDVPGLDGTDAIDAKPIMKFLIGRGHDARG